MKKLLIILLGVLGGILHGEALLINEIMSNPVGDDSGREWIEVYNNTSDAVDLSTLTLSIKGGNPIAATPISGGTVVSAGGYAIIASTVGGATKFLQDYPAYNGVLFKSSISLVNTGVTSVAIKINGITADTLSSYTAAKEGATLSLISGNFLTGNPTPGSENQEALQNVGGNESQNPTTTDTQTIVAQMSPPSANIVLYVAPEKTVVAGAETPFSVFGMTRNGETITNLNYAWAFGDGGQGTGSSTWYTYVYPGTYIAYVEATNGYVMGSGRTSVHVVAPDIMIASVATGKHGTYIDISNPNTYDLDLSQWKLSINNALFPFPKNTVISRGSITHFSGLAMGFASTTPLPDSVIKILFPNNEEVTRYHSDIEIKPPMEAPIIYKAKPILKASPPVSPAKQAVSTSSPVRRNIDSKKDTRIVAFFKSIFKR